jgi:hypothetical protein
MPVQALTRLPVNWSISTASKHMQDGVVWLALLADLERSSVRGQSRQREHAQNMVHSAKCFSPEQFRKLRLIKQHCYQLSQNTILALSIAVLLRSCGDCVLWPNAMFCKELIPDMANELAAFVLPEDVEARLLPCTV